MIDDWFHTLESVHLTMRLASSHPGTSRHFCIKSVGSSQVESSLKSVIHILMTKKSTGALYTGKSMNFGVIHKIPPDTHTHIYISVRGTLKNMTNFNKKFKKSQKKKSLPISFGKENETLLFHRYKNVKISNFLLHVTSLPGTSGWI